jgi:hypothetical protein
LNSQFEGDAAAPPVEDAAGPPSSDSFGHDDGDARPNDKVR